MTSWRMTSCRITSFEKRHIANDADDRFNTRLVCPQNSVMQHTARSPSEVALNSLSALFARNNRNCSPQYHQNPSKPRFQQSLSRYASQRHSRQTNLTTHCAPHVPAAGLDSTGIPTGFLGWRLEANICDGQSTQGSRSLQTAVPSAPLRAA